MLPIELNSCFVWKSTKLHLLLEWHALSPTCNAIPHKHTANPSQLRGATWSPIRNAAKSSVDTSCRKWKRARWIWLFSSTYMLNREVCFFKNTLQLNTIQNSDHSTSVQHVHRNIKCKIRERTWLRIAGTRPMIRCGFQDWGCDILYQNCGQTLQRTVE